MKKDVKILLLLFLGFISNTYAFSQGSYTYSKNYKLTIVPLEGHSTVSDADTAIRSVKYYDGYGRLQQEVLRNHTPSSSDLVILTEYAGLNKIDKQWLPTTNSGNGAFVAPSTFQSLCISTYSGDNYPYSKITYDNSPLERIQKQMDPGANWQSNGKGISLSKFTNTSSGVLNCYSYGVTIDGYLIKNGNYTAGKLLVTKMTDEDGDLVYIFEDLDGNKILERKTDGSQYYDTYYVYDWLNRLTYVLPPKASALLTQNTTYYGSEDNFVKYAFSYKYDTKNRLIEKKLPGINSVKYVYDKSDRVIFSQDGEQYSRSEWSFILYDSLGRVAIFGVCRNSNISQYSDSKINATFDLATNHFNTGYKINGITLLYAKILQVNYYDNYSFRSQTLGFSGELAYDIPPDGMSDTRYNAVEDLTLSRGLLTGQMVSQLNDSTLKQFSVYYYDSKDRVVCSKSTNHLGGFDKIFTTYNFSGSPVEIYTTHRIAQGTTTSERYLYKYDKSGRLKTVCSQRKVHSFWA